MLSNLKNIFKVPDLRNKILFTVMMVLLYRLGAHIRVPGIDDQAVRQLRESARQQGALGFLNLFSGGAFSSFAIFALGIMPYITSSIIMQVLTVVIPKLEEWQQEGATGQRKITQWTRYVAIAIATLQAAGLTFIFGQGKGSAFFTASNNAPDIVLLPDGMWPRGLLVIISLVAGTALLIVIFLLSTVVPQVAQVFSGGQKKLPALTVAMLALSDFVRVHGWTVALLLLLSAFGFTQAMKRPQLRIQFDAAFLRLPVIGRLATGYNTARFASTLAMLTAAGVPILKAMQSAADTLSNQAMREDVLDALVLVREGAPLAMAIGQKKRFPGLLAMFARLGEQTGQLPVMLQRAAQQLSADVQRRALALATVLEPLLIVLMGAVVMLIVLAVLMPIMELNQWVR